MAIFYEKVGEKNDMTVREKNEFRVCVVEIPAQNIQLPEIGLEKKKIKINFADGSYLKLEEREKKLQKLKSISVMCSPKLLSIGSVQKK